MPEILYKRVLVKLSGEALAGEAGFGVDFSAIDRLTEEIREVHAMGASLGLVLGGGNIMRGTTASQQGMDRVSADYIGMLATVINALAVQEKILDGKMKKFSQERALLDQPFVKDDKISVGQLVKEVSAKLGENVVVRRFVRYELGEE